MDQTSIETIIKATIEASNAGFDWKLAFAGLSAVAAFLSALAVVLSSYVAYKKTKLELNTKVNQEWGNKVIDAFSSLDGKDREMIKITKSFVDKVKKLEKAGKEIDEVLIEHDNLMGPKIKEHGTALTNFRLLFNYDSNEHITILDTLDNYNKYFLKRLANEETLENIESFDFYTNQLCKELGKVIHKHIKR